jgi:glycerophosphoryl diester phosphodiesterase
VANVARLHERGYRVMLYTVNDVAMAERFFEAGVDGLFTDNLEVFAERFPQMISDG